MRGYKPGRFSFNVKGGRCEACHGDGIIKLKCSSFQMSMYLVKCAMVQDITERHWKSVIKGKIFLMYLI